jgi:hypothetical protein
LIDEKIDVLIPPRFRQKHKQHHLKYFEDPQSRLMGSGHNFFAIKKDGTEYPVEISLSYYENEGDKFVISFINDISCRKKKEEDIIKLRSELESAVEQRTKDLQETDIDQALDNALNVYSLGQKELLNSGLDFVSYLNNRHVPLKDLVIEFVDHVFKHSKDDNNEHYLSYVYDIIAFIEKSYINSNAAINSLINAGFLEESYIKSNVLTAGYLPSPRYNASVSVLVP